MQTNNMIPRLLERYRKEIIPSIQEKFGYKTPMQVPRLKKIVINMGVGEAVADIKILDKAQEELALITGQRPIIRRAKQAIANFKIREGMPIGCKVTLRSKMMYEFLERLVTVAIPRIRDFRGYSTRGFDGQGNYNLGIKEQIVFPEIEYDKIDAIRGMDIAITTSANNDKEALALLSAFKFPLKDDAGV